MNKHNRDVFDALREGDPALVHSPEHDAVLRRNIKARVLDADRRPLRATRRKILVVALLVATTLLVTAAALYLTREPSDPRGIACYQAAALDAPQFIVDAPSTLHPNECESLWDDGTLVNRSVVPEGEIPELIGCVTTGGGLAVFPSNDKQLCDRLGLTGYEQPTRNDAIDLNQQLLDLFSTSGCMTINDAQLRIESILAEQGLNDWSVTISTPASTERPCASFSLSGGERRIVLVPIPRPNGE